MSELIKIYLPYELFERLKHESNDYLLNAELTTNENENVKKLFIINYKKLENNNRLNRNNVNDSNLFIYLNNNEKYYIKINFNRKSSIIQIEQNERDENDEFKYLLLIYKSNEFQLAYNNSNSNNITNEINSNDRVKYDESVNEQFKR